MKLKQVLFLALGALFAVGAAPGAALAQEDPPEERYCYGCAFDTETYAMYCWEYAISGKTLGCFFTKNSSGGWRCEAQGESCSMYGSLLPSEIAPDGSVLPRGEVLFASQPAGGAGAAPTGVEVSIGCGGIILGRQFAPGAGARARSASALIRI